MRPYIYEIIYNEVINEAAYAKQDVSAGHDSLEETSFLSLKSGSSFHPIRAGGSLTEGGDDDKIHIIHYRTLETAVHTAAGRE